MNNREIVIVVKNEIINQDGKTNPSNPTIPNEPAKPKEEQSISGSGIAKAIAIDAAKKAAQFAVSNYGNLTGDYQTQANIQGAIEMAGIGVAIMSGPIGIGVAVGALTLKAINQQIDQTKKRRATEQLRIRTGMMNYSGGRL